jgi:hypothetical protein
MRKKLLFVLMIASLLLSSFLPSINALAAGKTAKLDSLKFVPVKGWAVVFEVTGTWKPADLKGHTLSVGGKTIDLYCNFRDDNHISCTMESLNHYVGQTAVIFFGGQTFSAEVPGKRAATGFAECPPDHNEKVDLILYDSDGNDYIGWTSIYPSQNMTIDEIIAFHIAFVESFESVTIVSYEVLGVTCTPGDA